jgi:recombination protein U
MSIIKLIKLYTRKGVIIIENKKSKEAKETTKKKKQSTANRGLDWEDKINKKLEEYREQGIAVIHKVPTEIKMIRIFNPKLKRSQIVNAFPVEESKFVDYVGVYNKKPIAIEAKKCDSKTSFPFSNIKDTQYKFFKDWIDCGGLGYYLIWFKTLDKAFLITSDKIQEAKDTLTRKSIPIAWFNKDNVILLDKDLDFLKYIK